MAVSALGMTAARRASAAAAEEEGRRRKSGLMGLGAGPSIQLGGTTALKELGAAPGGLFSLATAWLPGGQAAGEVYSRAGKGIASSLMGTVGTALSTVGLPGTKWNLSTPWEAMGAGLLGEEYRPKDFLEKAGERGILPALIEDVGNVALGAGSAVSALSKAGTIGKLGGAARAAKAATEAGVAAEAITRAQAVGRAGQGMRGIRGAMKAEGLPKGRFTEVGRVARAERRVAGLADEAVAAADPAKVQRMTQRLTQLDRAAHPYQTVFRGAVRPLTRAAVLEELGRSSDSARAAEGAARELADTEALRQAHGTMPRAPERAPVGAAASDRTALQRAYGEQSPAARAMAKGRATVDEAADGTDVNAGLTPDMPETVAPRIGPREAAERAAQATPPPEWAAKTVAKLPEGAQGFLARREYGIQGRALNRVMREKSRFAEADRRAVLNSTAMTAARDAAERLINQLDDDGKVIDRVRAEGMVFDAVSRHLDQTAMLDELVRRGVPADHPLAAKISEATGQKFAMPQRFLADDDMRALLETAQGEFRTLAKDRRARLLGGRLGEQGLELIDEDTHQLTPRQTKEFRKIQAEYRRIARRMQPLAEKEAEAMAAELRRLDDTMSKLADEGESIRARQGAVKEEINDLARPVALQDASRQATFGTIATHVDELGGVVFDPHKGKVVNARKYQPPGSAGAGEPGYLVPVRGVTASLEEWTANPAAVLDDFAERLGPALQNQDARIHVQKLGDKVELTVSQTTINGNPMSRLEATILGQARGESVIGNLSGNDIRVATDPDSMAVAAHHIKALMDPRSQFNKFLRRWTRDFDRLAEWEAELAQAEPIRAPEGGGVDFDGPFLDEASLADMAQLHMRFALGHVNAGRYSTVDQYFGEFDVQTRASQASAPVDALFQTYLSDTFNPAGQLNMDFLKQVRKYLGEDADRALQWYPEGNRTVLDRWGDRTIQLLDQGGKPKDVLVSDLVFSILAITSVNASPISNMSTTMAALTAFTDLTRVDGWMGEINDAMQEYLKVREERFPAGIPSEAKGPQKGYMEEIARTKLWERLQSKIPHMDNVRDDVFEILSGRMLDEWDNEYLAARFQRETLDRTRIAERYGLAGTERLKELQGNVARARKAVDEATAKLGTAKPGKAAESWQAKLAERQAALTAAVQAESELAPKVRAQIEALPERELMELEGSAAYAKMRSFHDNLKNPATSDGATLDRVMADLLGLQGGAWQNKFAYHKAADALRNLAEEASIAWYGEPGKLRAHHLQAMLWVYCKRLTNEHDLGRLYAAALDTLDQIDHWDEAKWLEGQGLREWLEADIRHYEETSGITGRDVPVVEMKRGQRPLRELYKMRPEDVAELAKGKRTTQRQFGFFQSAEIKQKVAPQLEQKRAKPTKAQAKLGLPGTPESWAAVADDVAERMKLGDVDGARNMVIGWARDQAKRFSMEAEYFEDFFSRDPEALVNGYTPHGANSKAVEILGDLRRQGWIPELADDAVPGTSPLFQKFRDDVALGATFMSSKTGRLTMQFFKTADPTTLVHESGHLLRAMLPLEDIATLERIYGGAAGDVVFEERFADDLVRHMNTGAAPPGLEGQFGRVKEALRLWWNGVTGKLADQIDPGVAEILDRYLRPEHGDVPDLPAFKLDLEGKTAAQIASRLPARPGETADAARARGYRAGRKAAELEVLERKAAKLTGRQERMKTQRAQLAELLETGGGAKATEMRRALTATDRRLERFYEAADVPATSRVPGRWAPLWGAMEGLWELAAKDEAMAAAMEGLPKTFPELVRYAEQHGLDPTHVASIGDEKARRLTFDPLMLKTKLVEAGTRKERTTPFPQDRSLAALAAAQVDVILEQNTNALVTYIEDMVAQPLAEGQVIPRGWTAWTPADTFVKTMQVEGSPLRQSAGANRAKYMVPEHVKKMLDQYGRNYDHAILSKIRSVSNPWRTLVLTWTPRWYMNNVLGNMVLATKAGVRIEDWAAAWAEFRRGVPRNADRGGIKGRLAARVGRGDQAFQGTPGDLTEGVAGAVGPSLAEEAIGQQTQLTRARYDTVRQEAKAARRDVREAGGSKREQWAAHHNVLAKHAQQANIVIDDLARAAVYISQKRRGFSSEKALNMAFEAMVDYNDLSPIERGLVRTVVPFYSWQKGILKQLTRFPVDHPAASALAIQLGRLNEEMHEGLPEAYQMLFDTPLGTVNLRSINPFQDAEHLVTPQGIANAMNPFLGAMARNAYGAPASGYPEYQRIDEFGRVMPTTNPVEDFANIATGLPQVQLGAGAVGSEEVGGRPVGEYSGLRYLGVPMVSEERVEILRERLTKSRERLAKFEADRARSREKSAAGAGGRYGTGS